MGNLILSLIIIFSFKSLVSLCAEKAREKGYKYFGLQYYGECWSGPDSEDYAKDGTAAYHSCIQNSFFPCVDVNDEFYMCVGTEWTNYVYRVNSVVKKGKKGKGEKKLKKPKQKEKNLRK